MLYNAGVDLVGSGGGGGGPPHPLRLANFLFV